MASEAMEDYVKAIYTLQETAGTPVGTSAIAEYLGVTAPTVSSMLSSLEERELLTREKYAGVELTASGESLALEILRHHRLLETFLTEYLDYEWSEVHDDADVLEHHISESFERRAAAALDDPTVDPHGDPIPGEELSNPSDAGAAPLSAFEEGDRIVVVRVSDRDPDELEYLADAGVVPGTTVTISEIAPVGLYVLELEDETVHLPESIAAVTHCCSIESVDTSVDEEVVGP